VPVELIYRELRKVDPGWDAEAELLRQSQADMAERRQRDRERRIELKEEFRRSRGG